MSSNTPRTDKQADVSTMVARGFVPVDFARQLERELNAVTKALEEMKNRFADKIPDNIRVYYMHDNHTFTRLHGTMPEELAEDARTIAKASPYGMLCQVILCHGDKEVRRLKENVHARTELGDTSKWEAELRADTEAMALLAKNVVESKRGAKK